MLGGNSHLGDLMTITEVVEVGMAAALELENVEVEVEAVVAEAAAAQLALATHATTGFRMVTLALNSKVATIVTAAVAVAAAREAAEAAEAAPAARRLVQRGEPGTPTPVIIGIRLTHSTLAPTWGLLVATVAAADVMEDDDSKMERVMCPSPFKSKSANAASTFSSFVPPQSTLIPLASSE